MRISLSKKDIYKGNLILVNKKYACVEDENEKQVLINNSVRLNAQAAGALCRLMKEINGWRQIVPVSGWRSRMDQKQIWDQSMEENGPAFTESYVAAPDHSEHQTGLAIDLGKKQKEIDFIRPDFPYTGICQFFRKKAVAYGFIERYPEKKESITGISHEPWHFRYVGAPHAALMQKYGLTLEEYHAWIRQYPYGHRKHQLKETDGIMGCTVSFLPASNGETTQLDVDIQMPYTISGNNQDGFIVTEWRAYV